MSNVRVSDHALIQFLARAGGLKIESLRAQLAISLSRAQAVADKVGAASYTVKADGVTYVVKNRVVVTVLPGRKRRRLLRDGTTAP